MAKLDVGLKKENYVEDYVDLMTKDISLSDKNIKKLNDYINTSIILSDDELLKKRTVYYYWFSDSAKEVYLYDNYAVFFVSFIELFKGKLLYRIFAIRRKLDRRKKDKQKIDYMEVFRCLEGNYYGMVYSSHLYNNFGNGIRVYFNDEHVNELPSYMKYFDWVHTWKFQEYNYFNSVCPIPLYTVKELIELIPELKYSQVDIYSNPIYYLNYYRMYPGIEMLKKCGFSRLLKSKRCLNKINKADKGFMKFLYKCYELKYTFYDYNTYITYYNKYRDNFNNFDNFIKALDIKTDILIRKSVISYKGFDFERLAAYLTKHGTSFRWYDDYLVMAFKCGHNIYEDYWAYPNNLTIAHDKVMKELEELKKVDSHLKLDMLHEVVLDLMKFNCNVDGYDIFISDDVNIWKKQCQVLKACLIVKGYMNSVIQQKEIIVFIWKNGKPVATAQVYYDKTVGQFYADENKGNGLEGVEREKACAPSKEVQNAFYKWLEFFNPVKRKYEIKKKFYKGFYKKVNEKFYGMGNFEFEIGKVYETPFDDETIISAGAIGCNASNKVFHFCDSIEEISKHYSPTVYCEVEPLGPVLDYNGALLSNKIKIVREIELL